MPSTRTLIAALPDALWVTIPIACLPERILRDTLAEKEGNAMQLSDPVTPPDLVNPVGPVPCLPAPGEIYVCGQQVTAHIAVTGLVYCTAVFFFEPVSRARAMIHYNPVSGPFESDFRWCVNHLCETSNAQPGTLTVALFNNTSASNGKAFPLTFYKTDRIKGWLETALGPAHANMTATHYRYKGTIGLMDATGAVWGCTGPAIEDSVRATKMNWTYARIKKNQPQKNFLGKKEDK